MAFHKSILLSMVYFIEKRKTWQINLINEQKITITVLKDPHFHLE